MSRFSPALSHSLSLSLSACQGVHLLSLSLYTPLFLSYFFFSLPPLSPSSSFLLFLSPSPPLRRGCGGAALPRRSRKHRPRRRIRGLRLWRLPRWKPASHRSLFPQGPRMRYTQEDFENFSTPRVSFPLELGPPSFLWISPRWRVLPLHASKRLTSNHTRG